MTKYLFFLIHLLELDLEHAPFAFQVRTSMSHPFRRTLKYLRVS